MLFNVLCKRDDIAAQMQSPEKSSVQRKEIVKKLYQEYLGLFDIFERECCETKRW